jgi:hypothetical protein
MHFKRIALMALLSPIFGYSKNEARVSELKEAQYKKSIEIQEIAKRISEADEYIHSCAINYDRLVDWIIQKKKSNGIRIDKEKIRQELTSLLETCKEIFLGKRQFDLNLQYELFDKDDVDAIDSFKSLSFMCMHGVTERTILTSLVLRYQACLQELLNINQELKNSEDIR